ncbi:MAG: AAA family ATPase [Deltaproteobacteria bacterium]|nr:AAA family ATPase [Deltaproteobacteria bacterium]
MIECYPRWQKATIEQLMSERRVLLLSGPRQCGKTTLARELESNETEYRPLDDGTLREAADNDPKGFIKRRTKTLIIDEVQRVPSLLSAIKKAVDEDTTIGQYLLTGSTNIQSLPTVRESLAGRIAKIRLRPLTQGEIERTAPGLLIPRLSNPSRAAIPPVTVIPSWNLLSEEASRNRCCFRIVVESDGTPIMLMPYWNET